MTAVAPLPIESLHATFDQQRLPWQGSALIPESRPAQIAADPFQPRALHALDLVLHINAPDYHVYLSGEPNLGRRQMLLNYLRPQAAKMPTPPDLIYVPNFNDLDAPILIELPAGNGRKLRKAMEQLIEDIGENLDQKLDSVTFLNQRSRLAGEFHDKRAAMIQEMNELAASAGFTLDIDQDGGVSVCPLIDGKKIGEAEYDALAHEKKLAFRAKGDGVIKMLAPFLRRLNKSEDSLHERE